MSELATPTHQASNILAEGSYDSAKPGHSLWTGHYAFVVGVLWCAHLVLSAFYVFPSGLPQFCDFIIVLLLGMMLISSGLAKAQARTIRSSPR